MRRGLAMEQERKVFCEKIYRTKLGWRVFTTIGSIILIPLFVYVGLLPFIYEGMDIFLLSLFLIVIGFGFAILLICGVISILNYKIYIGENFITQRYLFKEVKLYFSEITGFRFIPNLGMKLYANDDKAKIEVSLFIEKADELFIWINDSFKSFDLEDIQKEVNELLEDQENEIEKQNTVKKIEIAAKIVKAFNILSMITGLWLLIYPKMYDVAIIINLILPFAAYGIVYLFKGIVFFDESRNTIRPSIYPTLIIPAIALALRAYLDIYVVFQTRLWLIFIGISICLSVIIMLRSKEYKKIKSSVIFFTIILTVYLYGAAMHVNYMFDNSTPVIYRTHVTDKRINEGNQNRYYIKLAPWEYKKEVYELSTSKNFYEAVIIGERINIYLKKGRLGIKWYSIGLSR